MQIQFVPGVACLWTVQPTQPQTAVCRWISTSWYNGGSRLHITPIDQNTTQGTGARQPAISKPYWTLLTLLGKSDMTPKRKVETGDFLIPTVCPKWDHLRRKWKDHPMDCWDFGQQSLVDSHLGSFSKQDLEPDTLGDFGLCVARFREGTLSGGMLSIVLPATQAASLCRKVSPESWLELHRILSPPFMVISPSSLPRGTAWLEPGLCEDCNLQDLWKTIFQKCALNFYWANSSFPGKCWSIWDR